MRAERTGQARVREPARLLGDRGADARRGGRAATARECGDGARRRRGHRSSTAMLGRRGVGERKKIREYDTRGLLAR